MQRSNPGYKPFHKKQVVLWIANEEEERTTQGGIIRSDAMVGDIISRKREGIIVGMSSGCFEDWEHKPKEGEQVSFRGYSGDIFQNEHDFYRIMEDKFLVTPTV